MVDWKSAEVVDICEFLVKQSFLLMLGIYFWEFVLSFPSMDLLLVLRQIRFRMSFVPYLLGRYLLLMLLLSMPFYVTGVSKLDCPGLGRLFAVLGTMPVACASTNLMIRTLAIWRNHALVYWPLIGVNAVHWAVIFISAFAWPDTGIEYTDRPSACHFEAMAVILFCSYTIVNDIIILVLTLVGLHRNGVLCPRSRTLWTTVYEQGIGYFVMALMANLPTLVLAILDLNPVLTIMTVIPAATVSVICSSRAVISLSLQDTGPRGVLRTFSSYRTRPLTSPFNCQPGRVDTDATNPPGQLTTDIHLPTIYDDTSAVEAGPTPCRL